MTTASKSKRIPGYKSPTQTKNLCWVLPRPKPDRYPGGMPLYCEEWLIEYAKDILKMDNPKILNVFCGMNKYGVRVDLRKEVNPDIIGDIHNIHELLRGRTFDIILADPPYSNEESARMYKTPKLDYSDWAGKCIGLLNPRGLFIVYHKNVMPNPRPGVVERVGVVSVVNRINHLPRVAIFFQKRGNP